MFYLENMCCLCLKKSTLPFTDLFTTDQNSLTHFDKISSSLTRIANAVELDSSFLLCVKCCQTIDLVYEFNKVSLDSIDAFISYKTMLVGNLEKKRCDVVVKLDRIDNIKVEDTISIKVESDLCSDFEKDENVQLSDYIVAKNNVAVLEDIVKYEEEEEEESTLVENYEPVMTDESEFKIEEIWFEKDSESFSDYKDELITSSQVDRNVEKHSESELLDEESKKLQLYKEDNMLQIYKEESKGSGSSSENQQFVVNEPVCESQNHNCTVCNQSFRYKSALNIHLRIHSGEKPFTCTVCNKSFRCKSNLNKHLRIHKGEKPFTCTVCESSFTYKYHLNKHMFIHSGEKPYVCDICNKDFSDKSNLTKHKLIHKGVKFPCDECDKSFSCKSTLVQHKRIHTGNGFNCDVCHKMFMTKILLNNHKRIHTGEKPYSCTVCNKSFTRIPYLNQHKRKCNLLSAYCGSMHSR